MSKWVRSCGGSTTNPTPAAPSAGVPFTITDLVVGGGAEATPGTRPVVNYTGWLYDANAAENKGAQFDTGMGFTFTLGAGQVIAGWASGVTGFTTSDISSESLYSSARSSCWNSCRHGGIDKHANHQDASRFYSPWPAGRRYYAG